MDSLPDDNIPSRTAVVITSRQQELQKLLAEERVRSEQRKTNYSTLKSEHLKLQKDFLSLQSEMRQVLEETKFIKDKKDTELDHLLKLIDDKDKFIDKLQLDLKQRDPQLIRDSFAAELLEPLKKLEKEKQVLVRDKERIVYELKIAKQKIDYLEKENIDAVERVKLSYDAEINLVKREKEELRTKLIEANQSPDVKRFTELTQDNAKLNARIKAYQSMIEQAETQYRKIETKVESLLVEQENSEKEYDKQISQLNLQLTTLRDANSNLRQLVAAASTEKDQLVSDVERLKAEIVRLNNQFDDREQYFLSEKEKIKRLGLKDLKDVEDEKNLICDELKKLRLENEAKNEAMSRLEQENIAKDKECQLQIISIRQQEFEKRCAIEQDKNTIQSKLKEIKEENIKLKEEMEQMKRQIENNSEQRLAMERESMIMRAKVESYQLNIEELEKLRRQHISLHDEVNKFKSDNTELSSLNKELIRQRESYKSDYDRIKSALDAERQQLEEFKAQSEKSLLKLRNCIEEERFDFRDKLLSLEREVLRCKKERDDIKAKYKQYVSIADKLQSKLDHMKEQVRLDAKFKSSEPIGSSKFKSTEPITSSKFKSTEPITSSPSAPDQHKLLMKELKLMKKKQDELSNLLNCTFESTHCKLVDQTQP